MILKELGSSDLLGYSIAFGRSWGHYKMEGFLLLSTLSIAMFLGCYISGSVPLAVSFSESKLRFVTVFGAGLLVGTALAVIIPEGVQSIYTAQTEAHNHLYHPDGHQHHEQAEHILDHSNVVDKAVGKMPDKPPDRFNVPPDSKPGESNLQPAEQEKEGHGKGEGAFEKGGGKLEEKAMERKERSAGKATPGGRKLMEADKEAASSAGHKHSHAESQPLSVEVHSQIGLALVIGFVFMLVVDQISKIGSGASDAEMGMGRRQPRYKMTATIGLVVHAAADGIALGAASVVSRTDIQFIVFMAIMLHKAPAAFGLVTFLLHEGLEKSRVRKHLLVFALAAPILAVITYVGIKQGGSETLSSLSTTGLLMLFSAGTFLYVATVHVLPEIAAQTPAAAPAASTTPHIGHSHAGGGPGFRLNELVGLILGALLPSVLTLGHSHSH